MAFIEPMHRNKPNITYLLTQLFLEPNMCDFQFIWRVLKSQILVVSWQN